MTAKDVTANGVTAQLDPLIHPITRLSICGLLAAGADWVEFAALRDAAGNGGAEVPDLARDPAALEQLRLRRNRLADRMRWPWWYQSGLAMFWALGFADPFLPRGVRIWPILLAALAVACLMQWGLNRVTGMKMTSRTLLHRDPGRPARIAMLVVAFAALGTEYLLIHHGLSAVAIAVAALAVVAEMAGQQAQLRGIRQELRGGGGAA